VINTANSGNNELHLGPNYLLSRFHDLRFHFDVDFLLHLTLCTEVTEVTEVKSAHHVS